MAGRIRRIGAAVLIAVSAVGLQVLGAHTAQAGSALSVAFTRNFNVYLTTATGGDTRTVTTRGTGYQGIWYPWYAWSPDGKYLLLLRWRGSAPTGTLLLLDARGAVLRTLATPPVPTDFWPSWAIDADQIAFVARQETDRAYGGFRNVVQQMDVSGHTHPLFSYRSHEGCGGGTSDPADRLYWQEVGFGGDAPRMSWSVKQGLAAYTASCAGGVNVIDLRTGRTLSRPHWIEPALSPRGTLAVVGPPFVSVPPPEPPVFLIDPRSGRLLHTIAGGELPTWSPNGGALYLVRRTRVRTLPARDPGGGPILLAVYRTSVLETLADGSHAATLFSTDAYALGPLNIVNGGRALIFSRIENDTNLWRHRAASGLLPIKPDGTSPYFPHVAVMRWERGGGLHVIEANAGLPVVHG